MAEGIYGVGRRGGGENEEVGGEGVAMREREKKETSRPRTNRGET